MSAGKTVTGKLVQDADADGEDLAMILSVNGFARREDGDYQDHEGRVWKPEPMGGGLLLIHKEDYNV